MSLDPTSAATRPLRVDVSVATGALRYGASGFLYGLSEDGVPTENTLAPIKPHIAAQKAPGGLQHPNGDAFRVSDTYIRAGGRQIQIYIQDIYPTWPYDNLGLDDYLTKVTTVVRAVVAHPHRERFAYVPLNEPDQIWYGKTSSQQKALRQDWKRIYQAIRSLDPTGPIVGPNFARYHEQFFAEFMAFCKDHDCLPEIISWHELNSDFYTDWYRNYDHYRGIERSLGLAPREIAINEYANFMDLSVPGQLIQWIARFEASKVDACLAYWHAAGDLCNLVVHQNQVTGGWWLYKWYADLTGHTVQVTPPNLHAAGLQGIAALDCEKRQIRVLFGGISGSVTVEIHGIDTTPVFGEQVHVRVWCIRWSGVEGVSRGPTFEMSGDYAVIGGQISIPIDTLEADAAYQMIITDARNGATDHESKPWRASYEAEAAAITSATIEDGGSLFIPNKNYCSNGRYVSDIRQDDSRVTFMVTVPAAGDYMLDIFYANPHGAMAQQLLQIDDGGWATVEYPPNVGPHFIATHAMPLALTEGQHTITLASYDHSVGRATLSVDLDKIELTCASATSATQWYPAEYASLSGSAVLRTSGTAYTGSSYVSGYGDRKDAATAFVISADAHQYHTISLHYAAGPLDGVSADRAVRIDVNGAHMLNVACPATAGWDVWATTTVQVFLQAGINRIAVHALSTGSSSAIWVDGISVGPGKGKTTSYAAAAAANTLSGTAFIGHEPYASGGQYVGGIGNGATNYLEFKAIMAAASGQYYMIIKYANAEKIGIHDYNVNIVDRGLEISVNGGPAQMVYCRNTFGWNSYRTTVVDIQLAAGANTIRFSNSVASAPLIDTIVIASL